MKIKEVSKKMISGVVEHSKELCCNVAEVLSKDSVKMKLTNICAAATDAVSSLNDLVEEVFDAECSNLDKEDVHSRTDSKRDMEVGSEEETHISGASEPNQTSSDKGVEASDQSMGTVQDSPLSTRDSGTSEEVVRETKGGDAQKADG